MRLLIVGGYGNFGRRIALLLADRVGLTMVIAGRSEAQARAFAATLTGRTQIEARRFDRDDPLPALRTIAPTVLIDASGPFQRYGTDAGLNAGLIPVCLSLGIHYLDLADGTEFVHGVAAFDHDAVARGVTVLSGASTLPALSGAVIHDLAADFEKVDAIIVGIAPSPRSDVGRNAVRAVLSYAGQRTDRLERGTTRTSFPFTDSRRRTIAPPGAVPLANLKFSSIDAPDARTLIGTWPGLRSVWLGAAARPEALHALLNAGAWLVRLRLSPALGWLTEMAHAAVRRCRWGDPRGGMFVCVSGIVADGSTISRTWHLIAEGDDGPFIPAMATAAIMSRWLDGTVPAPGARHAGGDLRLADIEPLFARLAIQTGIRTESAGHSAPGVFRTVLGTCWDRLPFTIRRLHDADHAKLQLRGGATVERGRGWLARLAASAFRFPLSTQNARVDVRIERDRHREVWTRNFDGDRFSSSFSAGAGAERHHLIERFGPFSFLIALEWKDERLRYIGRGWRFFRCRLPAGLAPQVVAFEACGPRDEFVFDVSLSHRWTGPIVRYRGWLDVNDTVLEGPALRTAAE